jgi:teichuronic acid biosynthesis glycosyltransferase TuaC
VDQLGGHPFYELALRWLGARCDATCDAAHRLELEQGLAHRVAGYQPVLGSPAAMRILVVTNTWPSREQPYRVIVARQVDGLRRAGLDAEVLSIEGFRSRFAYVRAAAEMLALNFRSRRYDVVHAHTGHCGILAALQLRYPVALSYVGYDLDGPAEDWEGLRTRLERLVFRYLSVFFAATIAKSNRGSRRVPRLGRGRNAVVPNGVDRDLFAPLPRAEARQRVGWHHDRPVVLFAGDPTRYTKNWPLAEAALAAAHARRPDLELVAAHPVPPDEMPLWMNASDVLLLTSVSEGSPNVVKEAMACNLPIVSVDVGDVRDIVAGTRNCYVCDAVPEALAAAVLDVVGALPDRSDGRERTAWLGLEPISERLSRVYEAANGRGPGLLGFLPWPGRRATRATQSGPGVARERPG